jgi:hypothetical protein
MQAGTLRRLVASGLATCARCGRPIAARAQFDLDHDDSRGSYQGVSHPRCNRQEGARKANGKRAADPWRG